MKKIGPYSCIRTLGKGGMGEVFLALDPVFGREIAIKTIRADKKVADYKERFLKEAKITALLTHPGVITIYALEEEPLYYTMPYVEGKTLKELLKQEAPIGQLLPIFVNVCQTVAYAHSKGVIHRDLKPENVLVGKFGEVVILDWGLAQLKDFPEKELPDTEEEGEGLTHPGKVVGTLAYTAPERALGGEADFQSDIYALGVILYQILTLRLPFYRTTLKELRKNLPQETFLDPGEVAPYRDIPPVLAMATKRCLEVSVEARYKKVTDLLNDLLSHVEGRAQWVEQKKLPLDRKKEWALQENILLSKHQAITRGAETGEWALLMLSGASFAENIRLETRLCLHPSSAGVGFLLSVPEAQEREHPLDGYCLWIGSALKPTSQLIRNNSLILEIPDFWLEPGVWHTLRIENIENKIHVYLDGVSKFNYVSYLPLLGKHVGVLFRDKDFEMEPLTVWTGSPTLKVSCLAIPDAFLAAKDFKKALAEYRRIATSFPGHGEGREALFRAGITLLEQAKASRSEKRENATYALALEEFGKLHTTPAAPLEYLGKSLVYQALKEPQEELKCLELSLRRYHDHPMREAIKAQILYRLQEASQKDRLLAYELVLLTLRHLPEAFHTPDGLRIFHHLVNHSEPLYFFEGKITSPQEKNFLILLAFWLANSFVYQDIYNDITSFTPAEVANLLFALAENGELGFAEKIYEKMQSTELESLAKPLLLFHTQCLKAALAENTKMQPRLILYLLQHVTSLDIPLLLKALDPTMLKPHEKILLDSRLIEIFLKEGKYPEAADLFHKYSSEEFRRDNSPLFSLYGCYLKGTQGEAAALSHFSTITDTPFPRTSALLGHELIHHLLDKPAWFQTSFAWERQQLTKALALYNLSFYTNRKN